MKYFRIIYKMTEGYRIKYALTFFIQIINVFFQLFASFLAMILIDVINKEEPFGRVSTFITNSLGGTTYLNNNLWVLAILIVSTAVIAAILSIIRHRIRAYIDGQIRKRNQAQVFKYLEKLDYSYLKNQKSGDIIQIATRDEDVLRGFVTRQLYMVGYTFSLITFSFVLLADISIKLALASIIILPVLAIFSFFVIKIVRKNFFIADESESMMTSNIEENIRGTRTVKAFNNETYEVEKFQVRIDDYEKKLMRSEHINNVYVALSDILVFGQISLTTVFGVFLTYTQEISIGALFLGITYAATIVWPVRSVATILSQLAKAIASMDRMETLFNAPVEDLDSGQTPAIYGNIEFNNVSFKFSDSNEAVLHDISFKVSKGQTVAIMGKTGSGKSTLAHLLSRLYEYDNGSISLDNNEITAINKRYLRKNIAVVLQEPFLFSKTILSNLQLADQDADLEMIKLATQTAKIHDSIASFKDGYQTRVGEQGVTLSGGQKQRLSIARTLIRKSPILVFDDSLSAVDTKTDLEIREALKNRRNADTTTTLIITHRVATAKDADLIIVLDNGRIIEQGTHQQLIKNNLIYKDIYDIQTKME